MSDYSETLSKHRRLTILKFLADSPEYTSNASILTQVCKSIGVSSTRDQVMTDLDWLKEQGFVTLQDSLTFRVATATGRGLEIASGEARNAGVQRPRPGA